MVVRFFHYKPNFLYQTPPSNKRCVKKLNFIKSAARFVRGYKHLFFLFACWLFC